MPRRARTALEGAAILLALLFASWVGAFHVSVLARADLSILRGFAGLGTHPHLRAGADFFGSLCDPNPYVYFCAAPILVALVRRRPWSAVAIAAILLGANVTTELLKPGLASTHAFRLSHSSVVAVTGTWPSGHATAAMSLALCAVIAAPARLRPIVASLGAAFAVAVCYSILALEWHYPSDVLAGLLIAGIWTLLGVAAVFIADAQRLPGAGLSVATGRRRMSVAEALGPPTTALLVAIVLAAIVVVARPLEVVTYVRAHQAFVVGAGAIAAFGLALATGVMLALRR